MEIELRTDILFPSGSATIASSANAVLEQLADTLKPLPYPMRVQGQTDNMPINTVTFPSNWELSAAHLFSQHGMDPTPELVRPINNPPPTSARSYEVAARLARRGTDGASAAPCHRESPRDAPRGRPAISLVS